ncbi:hypothetical protein BG003_009369 [Podila horticola]|nr:hypothetical protein BG003_009369 [Podila horticola]
MTINTNTKGCPQNKLPTEVLEQILQYLPRGEIPSCMRVSRQFQLLAHPFLDREFYFTFYPPSRPPPIKQHIRTIHVMSSLSMNRVYQFILGVDVLSPATKNPVLESLCPRLRALSVQSPVALAPGFYDLLSYMPRLTRLELEFTGGHSAEVDLPLLLTLLPNLLHLALARCVYREWTGLSTNQTERPCLNGLTHLAARSFPLRFLAHRFELFQTVDPVLMLSMLPDLRELSVGSRRFFRNSYENHFYDPIEYARALQKFCPHIERYNIIDWLPQCLFLPRFVASTPITLSLTPTPRPEIASPVFLPGSISSLSSADIVPVLPKLKNLRCAAALNDIKAAISDSSSVSLIASQDLCHLDQLAHLVRLDISLLTRPLQPDLKDVPQEMARLGQTPVTGRDILQVLESCPNLKTLLARGRVIRFEEMLERVGLEMDDMHKGEEQIAQWACRDHLETLSIGISVSTCSAKCHRFVWAHLAQLVQMKHLMLTTTTLFVALTHGLDLTGHWTRLETFGIEVSPWPFADDETAFWMGKHWERMNVYYLEKANYGTLTRQMEARLQAGAVTRLQQPSSVNLALQPAHQYIPPW